MEQKEPERCRDYWSAKRLATSKAPRKTWDGRDKPRHDGDTFTCPERSVSEPSPD